MSADTLTVTAPSDTSRQATATRRGPTVGSRMWNASWPKLLAVAIVVGIWQLVYLSGHWKPYILPSPFTVFATLGDMVQTQQFWHSVEITLRRAVVGYFLALAIGSAVGIAVARVRTLRLAVGSLITGLQTMPSIAWFPLAILLFGITEQAIMFVVVLGAAPSIANGIIAGIDHVPPAFTRLGKVMGAGTFGLYRYVVIPAALPSYVAGLSQGWAFAWRSLMAGELLVLIVGAVSLGASLNFAREQMQPDRMLAIMIVILVIGMLADIVFSGLSRQLRRRRGLAVDD